LQLTGGADHRRDDRAVYGDRRHWRAVIGRPGAGLHRVDVPVLLVDARPVCRDARARRANEPTAHRTACRWLVDHWRAGVTRRLWHRNLGVAVRRDGRGISVTRDQRGLRGADWPGVSE